MRALIALGLIAVSLWVLERARSGVEISAIRVGETPVSVLARPGADGPAVVIAHGFAGSSQMTQGYALPLSRAGYRVHSFDFLGHGRHPVPMSGDLTAIDGTTRLLAAQTGEIIDAAGGDGRPVALIGHSMATDILVRVAAGRADTGPVVLISAFSREIDATTPQTLLLVTGQWEPGLRDFAQEALHMVDPAAAPGQTATAGPVTRRAVVAPWTEHVSVLQSRAGRRAALDWLDQAYGRVSDAVILPTGHAIIGLVAGLALLFGAFARRLPGRPVAPVDLAHRETLEQALACAEDMARHWGAQVTYVGVTSNAPGAVARTAEEFGAKLAEFAQSRGEAAGIETHAHTGIAHDPATEVDDALLRAVKELDVDLVVMATHVPGLTEYVWPSNGGRLAEHARCSVFLVRH